MGAVLVETMAGEHCLYRCFRMYMYCAVINGYFRGKAYYTKHVAPVHDHSLYTTGLYHKTACIIASASLSMCPPLFMYSMFHNLQRAEVRLKGLDPEGFKWYHDRL